MRERFQIKTHFEEKEEFGISENYLMTTERGRSSILRQTRKNEWKNIKKKNGKRKKKISETFWKFWNVLLQNFDVKLRNTFVS